MLLIHGRVRVVDLLDVVSNLLHGEKELESYLRANPPSEENVGKAKESLASAEKHLRYVSTRCPKEKVVYPPISAIYSSQHSAVEVFTNSPTRIIYNCRFIFLLTCAIVKLDILATR